MNDLSLCAAVITALSVGLHAAEAPRATAPAKSPALVEIALLLDTSGSMNGLIDQAKAQLWKVVNELALARRGGGRADVRVSLYEYGNDSLKAEEGFVRQVLPLTTDLDRVSEELFRLTTNGGQEYCGTVIERAVESLAWSTGDDYRAIFIAGNEPFSQGSVDYREACRKAIARGIVVNTIFCGPAAEGISGGWKDGSVLADGGFSNIDQNHAVAHIAAPQDEEIVRLGGKLNETYLPFGSIGFANLARQSLQDANVSALENGADVERAACKSGVLYRNATWDLVDALKEGQTKVEDLKEEDLPEVLRKMSVDERKAHVKKMAAERKRIQDTIRELNLARLEHVAQEQKKLAKDGIETLDAVLIRTLRAQCLAKNFEFEEPAHAPQADLGR